MRDYKFLRFILRWFVSDRTRLTLAVTSLMESAVIRPNQMLELTITTKGKSVDWTDMTFAHTPIENEEDPHDDSKD